jgi:hypothetical protein
MSPYVIFAIAMLGIVIIALVVTGNLAAGFNERAKRDLRSTLDPLAEMLEGSVELESAQVNGRHHGQITTAQVVSASRPPSWNRQVARRGLRWFDVQSLIPTPGSAPSRDQTVSRNPSGLPFTTCSMISSHTRVGLS